MNTHQTILLKHPDSQATAPTTPEARAEFKAIVTQASRAAHTMTPTDLAHSRLRMIPHAVAKRLVQMNDPTDIAELLLSEINKALAGSGG